MVKKMAKKGAKTSELAKAKTSKAAFWKGWEPGGDSVAARLSANFDTEGEAKRWAEARAAENEAGVAYILKAVAKIQRPAPKYEVVPLG
jgi:hypothetical protein